MCAPAARGGSKERAERGEGSRESIADGTALRDIVGEEVAATLRTSEIRLGDSFFV